MRSIRRSLGRLMGVHPGRILAASSCCLLLLCVALKSYRFQPDQLTDWLGRSARLDAELKYLASQVGEGAGSYSQLLLQELRQHQPHPPSKGAGGGLASAHATNQSVLSVHALMVHLESLAIASHVAVELYGVTWSLKDLCFAPTVPDFGEGFGVYQLLENMMPCAIKTPLDCFWEGSKLLGPEQAIRLRESLPPFKWSSTNPLKLVETMQHHFPHASFPYENLLAWMRRIGIGHGYLGKPCLDPTDPNCPLDAPNGRSKLAPDVAKQLTGGCSGVAENLMQWHEEELVGGAQRKPGSGQLVSARALQSVIQLMGETDVFEFWRKTDKVQDINNWSADKARQVLSLWQQKFRDELAEFVATSPSAKPFKIHALTSNSMDQPLDSASQLDLTVVGISLLFLTSCACATLPHLPSLKRHQNTLLSLSASLFIALSFLASLGASLFIDLPLNMATMQFLPPLALACGFNQLFTLASIYSDNIRGHSSIARTELSCRCLDELIPVITLDSACYITGLLMAAILPVPATRALAFQAICYVILSAFTSLILLPSLFNVFLARSHHLVADTIEEASAGGSQVFSITGGSTRLPEETDRMLEEQIFSRIKDDLKNIKADASPAPSDIHFSAQLEANGVRTSFKLTTKLPRRDPESRPKPNAAKFHPSVPSFSSHKIASGLPDLVAFAQPPEAISVSDEMITSKQHTSEELETDDKTHSRDSFAGPEEPIDRFFSIYRGLLTDNKLIQAAIYVISLCTLVTLATQTSKVQYGFLLTDVIVKGTAEYEPYRIRDTYFSTYNIFAVIKGNFDYATNQKLLYELNQSFERTEGVIEDKGTKRFWLARLRDWLKDLQRQFDIERNQSMISHDGWTADASDASKLAYKLLAQTGRIDNPVNKSLVRTNRLVDSSGIINPKAFYYYVFAWVVNDPYSYSTSEACFKPEYKAGKWKDDPDILKIERPLPIVYSQIPYLLDLPVGQDSLGKVLELRSISQEFERVGLPNFPTGPPITFWEQFIGLNLVLFATIVIGLLALYLFIGCVMSSFTSSMIVCLPICITIVEMYGFVGYLGAHFNNVVAILLLSALGTCTTGIIQLVTCFHARSGDLSERTRKTLKRRSGTVLRCLGPLFICAIIFQSSRLDFVVNYSNLLMGSIAITSYNALLLTPVLLGTIGFKQQSNHSNKNKQSFTAASKQSYTASKQCNPSRTKAVRKVRTCKQQINKSNKKRRVQTEISLSTISEEPQAEMPDLKLDFSIRCY